jgi:hypothetical protein
MSAEEDAPNVKTAMQLDGEVISGRLAVYADSLVVGLVGMAEKYAALSPEVLLYAGITPQTVAEDLAQQLAVAIGTYTPDAFGGMAPREGVDGVDG